jgi:hypothetical protein
MNLGEIDSEIYEAMKIRFLNEVISFENVSKTRYEN